MSSASKPHSFSPIEQIAPLHLLAAITAVAAVPFLLVELFTSQLYHVFDISHYLVFHNVAEFFSVMVSLSIFGLGWYSYDQNQDRHSLFLSVAFLAIGLMDFMHALGYAGMPPLLTPNTANKSTQFWIAVRLFSAAAFLSSAFVYAGRTNRWLSKSVLMTAALAISFTVFFSVTFLPDHVPATFVQGEGLTLFKKVSEYVIISLLVLAAVVYWRRLSRTGDRLINYYLAAFVLCIFSELVFAVYKSVFDTFNVLGHIYKIIAFGMIYKGIFIASVRKPYQELLRSNDELRRNRNMLSHIMNSIPQSIFWKDRESLYLGCNQVFARQAGIERPADIIGKSDFDLPWSRTEADAYRSDDRAVMEKATAKHHIIETQLQTDGTTIWIDTTKIPLTDSSGAVFGVLGVFDDISESRQAAELLQKSKQQFDNLVSKIKIGVYILHSTPEGSFTLDYASPRFSELVGFSVDSILADAQVWFQRIHPDDLDGFVRLNQEGIRLRRSFDWKGRILTEGKVKWLHFESTPEQLNNSDFLWHGVVTDITESKLAEEALLESEQRFRLGFENANIGMCLVDTRGKLLRVNQYMCDMFGYSTEEFEGMDVNDIAHPDYRDVSTNFIRQSNVGEIDHTVFEKAYIHKQGRLVWGQVSSSLIRNSAGEPLYFISHVLDITERKLAAKALENIRTLQAETEKIGNVGGWEFDIDTRVLIWTDEVYRIHEVDDTFRPTLENAINFYVPDSTPVITAAVQRSLEYGEPFDLELEIVTAKGTRKKVSVIGKADREHHKIFGFFQDITRRKQAECELQKKSAEIEQFIYTVSHDLRSPLVTVKTFMGYLEKDLAEGKREQLSQDIRFIHGAADKMKLLLDELLEMSRIGRIEAQAVRVPFRELLEEVLKTLAGVIQDQTVDIRLPETELVLFGDRLRLCQIWQNLVENAIKYSSNTVITHIDIGLQQLDGETVFSVRDNGIGIDPHYHGKIFGIFEKLDQKSPGAGLGLSMVQRIVEKYGGRIWVESEGGGSGACFYFTLPGAMGQE